jgi:hypothetical protein
MGRRAMLDFFVAPDGAHDELEPIRCRRSGHRGRHRERIFASPRGRAWTLPNAQETLARLLAQLGEGRYTLHGLRATGPTELERGGMERRPIRDLTGHQSERTLEVYLRGAGGFPGRRRAAEALQTIFAPVLGSAEPRANPRRFSGVTGRAARVATEVETGNSAGPATGRKARKT